MLPVSSAAAHRYLAAKIREQVRKRGWSQNQLADFAGISRGHISHILTLKKSPTVDMVVRIAKALEVSAREFFPK